MCSFNACFVALKCWASGKRLKLCDTEKIETFTLYPLTSSASEGSSKWFTIKPSFSTHLPESGSKRVCMKCGGKKEKRSHYSRQPRSLSEASHQLLTLVHVSRISLPRTVSIIHICLSIFFSHCNSMCSSSQLLNVTPVEPLYLLQHHWFSWEKIWSFTD